MDLLPQANQIRSQRDDAVRFRLAGCRYSSAWNGTAGCVLLLAGRLCCSGSGLRYRLLEFCNLRHQIFSVIRRSVAADDELHDAIERDTPGLGKLQPALNFVK